MSRLPSALASGLASGLVLACGPSHPPVGARAAIASSVGAEQAAPAPSTCDIPVWDSPPRLVSEVRSVPSAAVTRACEQLASRARHTLRAPAPASWQEASEDAQRARRELEEAGSDEVAIDPLEQVASLRSSVGRCVPAGVGAWALEALGEHFDGDDAYTASVRVVHVDADGSMRTGAAIVLRADDEWRAAPSLAAVFDFDADGRVEVVLTVSDGDHAQLLTATREGVHEVALPLEIGAAHWIDYDADGRPDLLADRLYVQAECYEWSNEWGMPSLLLHAGEGLAFSPDDAVARRYAEEICPCAPTRLLAPPRYADDDPLFSEQTLVRIACARLWGVSPSVIDRRLAAEMEAVPVEERHEGDVCAATIETLTAFAHPDPPLRLDR